MTLTWWFDWSPFLCSPPDKIKADHNEDQTDGRPTLGNQRGSAAESVLSVARLISGGPMSDGKVAFRWKDTGSNLSARRAESKANMRSWLWGPLRAGWRCQAQEPGRGERLPLRMCSAPLPAWLKRDRERERLVAMPTHRCLRVPVISPLRLYRTDNCGWLRTPAGQRAFPLGHTESWHTIRPGKAEGSELLIKHRPAMRCSRRNLGLYIVPLYIHTCFFFILLRQMEGGGGRDGERQTEGEVNTVAWYL